PAARSKPSLIDRICNPRLRLPHLILELRQPLLLRILPWTHAQHSLEPAQNRQPPYTGSLRYILQLRPLVCVFLQILGDRNDGPSLRIILRSRPFRLATPASPVPGSLGRSRSREEGYLLPRRSATGTTRLA